MRLWLLILIAIALLFTACRNAVSDKKGIPKKNDDAILVKKDSSLTHFEMMDELQSHMKNKVVLDSLMISITNQKNVTLVAELKKEWNDTTHVYSYSAANYNFELKIDNNKSATFKDGNTKIKFANYSPTCPPDPNFKCEDYGFIFKTHLKIPGLLK